MSNGAPGKTYHCLGDPARQTISDFSGMGGLGFLFQVINCILRCKLSKQATQPQPQPTQLELHAVVTTVIFSKKVSARG